MKENFNLINYIENLRKRGKYLFLKDEACQALDISGAAFLKSVHRLFKKGKTAHLKKGLYQIIIEEYANDGSLPPEWFIDDLMTYLEAPYYVGLLTAASMHGSSHHATQIFQVVCAKVIPPLAIGSVRIMFYYNKNITQIPTQKIKVPSGYMNLSTPESTAFDLLRYLHQSGHLNNVATVLSELAEAMTPEKTASAGNQMSIRYSQRLGYILDTLGFEALAKQLNESISAKLTRYIPLRSDTDDVVIEKNQKWHILVNEALDTDV